MVGPGMNFAEDAVYAFSQKDADGKDYDGSEHDYVMRFEKGQIPPVKGFWSLTMYDPDFFFVPNPLERYSLSQRDTFVTNADGSVDLYLQAESPDPDKEANWLPAPKGKFIPMTPSSRWPGRISRKSRSSSPCRTPVAATTSSGSSTCGATCSRRSASGRREPRPRTS
jgi:hypothetical protein